MICASFLPKNLKFFTFEEKAECFAVDFFVLRLTLCCRLVNKERTINVDITDA